MIAIYVLGQGERSHQGSPMGDCASPALEPRTKITSISGVCSVAGVCMFNMHAI